MERNTTLQNLSWTGPNSVYIKVHSKGVYHSAIRKNTIPFKLNNICMKIIYYDRIEDNNAVTITTNAAGAD